MFTQDFTADFDAVLAAEKPFALVRFGDGELALIDGRAHQSADAWRSLGPTWLRKELVDSLRAHMDGWHVGLPPLCCIGGGLKLRATARVPLARQTFATLFIHGNLARASELRDRYKDAVIVGSWYGEIRIPADGVTQTWDVDSVVAKLLEVDKPILLAAGPCSNIIALRYWTRQASDKRQSIIDVGSAFDVLNGKKTRHYHDTMLRHICTYGSRQQPSPRNVQVVRPVGAPDLPTQEIREELPSNRRQITKIGRHAPHAIPHGRIRKATQHRK
jgi:hypothetical protein